MVSTEGLVDWIVNRAIPVSDSSTKHSQTNPTDFLQHVGALPTTKVSLINITNRAIILYLEI